MAKHSRGSGGTPPPDPFKPADADAYAELQAKFPTSAEALEHYHGDPPSLETALENTLAHLVEADQTEARHLIWQSMGMNPPEESA